MQTDSREMLAVGIFGSRSRIGERIEMLVRAGRKFSGRVSAGAIVGGGVVLGGLLCAGALAPRWIAFAQELHAEFEVASIRLTPPQNRSRGLSMRGGPGTPDPSQIAYSNVQLLTLLRNAYHVWPFQIAGPASLTAQSYDVSADIPPGTTREQLDFMLQNLLIDRFHIVLHRETRTGAGYELVEDTNGAKLTAASLLDSSEQAGVTVNMKMQENALNIWFSAKKQPLSRLVQLLGEELGRPVVDKTRLNGTYDYTLRYAPAQQPGGGADDAGPSIFAAVSKQLGLKLQSKKDIAFDMIVVDSADTIPAPN